MNHTQVVETAAPVGMGLLELEEAVLLQADLLELCASQEALPEATVVETRVDTGQGPIATVVLRKGCLQVGQAFVVGKEHGRVRSIVAFDGTPLETALPGAPSRDPCWFSFE